MDQVLSKFDALKKSWKSKKLDKVGEILEELKIALTTITFLPTASVSGSHDEQALLIGREVLEIGAQHSVSVRDAPAFQRYMAILKTYYMDYSGILPESAKMYELLGLNLLCLLSQNNTAEFHTELELLPAKVIQENPYIASPVRLEQFIMEGSYNKVNKLWNFTTKLLTNDCFFRSSRLNITYQRNLTIILLRSYSLQSEEKSVRQSS